MARSEPIQPQAAMRGLPAALVGIPLGLLGIGVVLLAVPPLPLVSYFLNMYLLLAALTVLQGFLGVLILRWPVLASERVWAAIKQGAQPRRQPEALLVVTAVLVLVVLLVVLAHAPLSPFFRGGLLPLLLQSYQGMFWFKSLHYFIIKSGGEAIHPAVIWFLFMWLGLALWWFVAGFLAYAFGVIALFIEAVPEFLLIAALYILL